MNRTKKSAALRSKVEGRRAEPKRAAKPSDAADRQAIRKVLARHDIGSRTKKIIEDLAVEYGPALKRLADR